MRKRFSVTIKFIDSKSPKAEERLKRAYGRLISLAVDNILAREEVKEVKEEKVSEEVNNDSAKDSNVGIISI